MRVRIGKLRGRLAGGAVAAVLLGGAALLTAQGGRTAPEAQPRAEASESSRPPVPADHRALIDGDVEVIQKWSLASNGKLMRIYSARRDLTGFQELGMAIGGRPHGDARCTQQVRLDSGNGTGERVETKPTLLVCWRTSARKSVYTVLVDTNRTPSAVESVAQLDEAWKKLS